jgi:hypothetical protein
MACRENGHASARVGQFTDVSLGYAAYSLNIALRTDLQRFCTTFHVLHSAHMLTRLTN